MEAVLERPALPGTTCFARFAAMSRRRPWPEGPLLATHFEMRSAYPNMATGGLQPTHTTALYEAKKAFAAAGK